MPGEINPYYNGVYMLGAADESLSFRGDYLSAEAVKKIAGGFSRWLLSRVQGDAAPSVALGYDCRNTSKRIYYIFLRELLEHGIDVCCCDMATPPAVLKQMMEIPCSAAAVITGGNNHPKENGFKFYTRTGLVGSEGYREIYELSKKNDSPPSLIPGEKTEIKAMNMYSKSLREMICREINATDYARPLRDMGIMVDAGNGMGGFFANTVLAPLGADISKSICLDEDGDFPNRFPDPLSREALEQAAETVKREKLDMGFLFDLNGDRITFIDGEGNIYKRNRLIALASVLSFENISGATAVTNNQASLSLQKFTEEKLGCKLFRFGKKPTETVSKQIELTENGVNAPFSMTVNGNFFAEKNNFIDDGAFLAVMIVIKAALIKAQGEKISSLTREYRDFLPSSEVYMKVDLNYEFEGYCKDILSSFEGLSMQIDRVQTVNSTEDCVEIIMADKYPLSLFTDRVDKCLRLKIDCDDSSIFHNLGKILIPFFEKFPKLDSEILRSLFSGD